MSTFDRLDSILKAFDDVPSIAVNSNNNVTNMRLHVQFNHCGVMCFIPEEKKSYHQILDAIWKIFGVVTDVFYHNELSYCFLSCATHAEAEKLMQNLNDEVRLQAAIDGFLSKLKSSSNPPQMKASIVQKVKLLFQKRGYGGLLHASWASPRSDNSHHHRERRYYDYEEEDRYHHGDDCPDGFEQDEWDAYCEGRD